MPPGHGNDAEVPHPACFYWPTESLTFSPLLSNSITTPKTQVREITDRNQLNEYLISGPWPQKEQTILLWCTSMTGQCNRIVMWEEWKTRCTAQRDDRAGIRKAQEKVKKRSCRETKLGSKKKAWLCGGADFQTVGCGGEPWHYSIENRNNCCERKHF